MEPNRLDEVLAAVCAAQPDHTAIVEQDQRVSYGDLATRISELTATLKESGIRTGDRVALILPNGVDFIAAAFAVWSRRAVLVPLHIRYQEQEILRLLHDCQVRAIFAAAALEPIMQSILGTQTTLKHVWLRTADSNQWTRRPAAAAARTESPEPQDSGADWPAVIQYSTGSTGTPKRVTRSHQQLVSEFRSVSTLLGIRPDDRILGAAPFYHSYGIGNAAICPILGGTTLYAVNDFFPRDIVRLIERERITGFPGVPFMYQMLAEQRTAADFSSMRYALSAGAPLLRSTAQAFQDKYGVAIRQLYGSTETGCICIERVQDLDSPSVGPPIPGVSLTIVDDDGLAVGPGVQGNVGVRSPFAASGYDNVTGKTDSFFQDGGFYPGDLGCLLPDGRLALAGRTRQYINVGGNKVDPSEVEAVLAQHPAVAEAVVVGVADGAAGQKIKAVLVTTSACTRTEILDHCLPRLAEFKRPRVVEFRDEIPKSPLGKILRKYLVDQSAS